jgi:hypothetical protein
VCENPRFSNACFARDEHDAPVAAGSFATKRPQQRALALARHEFPAKVRRRRFKGQRNRDSTKKCHEEAAEKKGIPHMRPVFAQPPGDSGANA